MTGAAKTAKKQSGRPFKKGKSGNPNGRPQGSRNKATLAIEELLDGEAEGLTRKAVELAMEGDTTALRLCLDRLCPPRKDRPVSFDLPTMKVPADAVAALRRIGSPCMASHRLSWACSLSPAASRVKRKATESA